MPSGMVIAVQEMVRVPSWAPRQAMVLGRNATIKEMPACCSRSMNAESAVVLLARRAVSAGARDGSGGLMGIWFRYTMTEGRSGSAGL
jgi:hypothetical protein